VAAGVAVWTWEVADRTWRAGRAGVINQIFYGYVGDVRIVNRALPVSQFMINS
jgi:hypothetical protein